MADPVYLDEQGNPIQANAAAAPAPAKAPVYLDDNGEPKVTAEQQVIPKEPSTLGHLGGVGREAVLGGFSGLGLGESEHPVSDAAKGIGEMTHPTQIMGHPIPAMLRPFTPLVAAPIDAVNLTHGIAKSTTELPAAVIKFAKQPSWENAEGIAHGYGNNVGMGGAAVVGDKLVSPKGIGIADKIPSEQGLRASAERGFSSTMKDTGEVPVQTQKFSDSLLRVKDLADRGGTMPTSVNKLLNRVTRPDAPPLTYKEARDFYSNISRLSADEAQRLTPPVKRAVGDLRVKFGQAIEDSADTTGHKAEYVGAMKDYSKAARVRDVKEAATEAVKNHAVKGALGGLGTGVGLGLGYKLYRAFDK